MKSFLIINDWNDMNEVYVRHYSIDKGWFMAQSLAHLNQKVYFLTTLPDYVSHNIQFICDQNIDETFLAKLDYLLIAREAMFFTILQKLDCLKQYVQSDIHSRVGPQIIIKSDYPLWFTHKCHAQSLKQMFGISRGKTKKWLIHHINYICAQNDTFKKMALDYGLLPSMIIVSKMGIPIEPLDASSLVNPYHVDYRYLVDYADQLGQSKALMPYPYTSKDQLSVPKYIIVYTGRIKTDNGRILYNMRHIMQLLGNEYQLHIFPGSFVMPETTIAHSGKNKDSLDLLRKQIFPDATNIIIHYPYPHHHKYQYLQFAHCGIDFSDVRSSNTIACADHAKLLEYCESGLPVVCEENIHNLYLIKQGKNGIILPYLASNAEYADAIQKIVHSDIDREYCRNTTRQTENWHSIASDLISCLVK